MKKPPEKDMRCRTHALNELKTYKYVVVLSFYRGKILLSRHRNRDTWETQGGHIERGETPLDAAKRELYEESGATRFTIAPAFDYWAGNETDESNGMVFVARVEELADLPDNEMREVGLFDALPDALTYPDITPRLFERSGVLPGTGGGGRADAEEDV